METIRSLYNIIHHELISKVKLATVVKGNQEVPFSISTTLRCRGGHHSFPRIAPLPLIHTLYCWVLSKEVSSIIFKVFGMMQPRIKPRSPRPLANTLSLSIYIYIYITSNIYAYLYSMKFLIIYIDIFILPVKSIQPPSKIFISHPKSVIFNETS